MDYIWQTEGITKEFNTPGGIFSGKEKTVYALNGISLQQAPGETLGIVGESGCGKSTFGRVLMGLYAPTSGILRVGDRTIDTETARKTLHHTFQMVFQDPYASLNPRMTVRQTLEEPLRRMGVKEATVRSERIRGILEQVGLRPSYSERYPHEFSGGQRQRVGIARALISNPSCIICDEPISALDVSIQVQIITLLERLQADTNISYVFISHDLSMVHYLSHRIAVMYLGYVVEEGTTEELYNHPLHPYTQALIRLHQPIAPRMPIGPVPQGEVPSPLQKPKGCPFASRCPEKEERCMEAWPQLTGNDVHRVACWKR